MLVSLVVSTVVFFVASYFIKRWADDNDFPKGMTRNASIFVAALAIAYAASWLIERVIG